MYCIYTKPCFLTLFKDLPCPLYFSMLFRIFDSSLSVIFRTTVADKRASNSNCRASTSSSPIPSCSLRRTTARRFEQKLVKTESISECKLLQKAVIYSSIGSNQMYMYIKNDVHQGHVIGPDKILYGYLSATLVSYPFQLQMQAQPTSFSI